MKKRVKSLAICLCAALALIGTVCGIQVAVAGIGFGTIVDSSSIEQRIDSSVWYIPRTNRGVAYAPADELPAGIEFGTASTRDSRLVSIAKAEAMTGSDNTRLFTADVELTVRSLPEGVRFGLLFGLPGENAVPGIATKGNADVSLVYFEISGGALLCGISNYTAAGEETCIAPAADTASRIGDPSQPFTLRATVGLAGDIEVYVSQFPFSADSHIPIHSIEQSGCLTAGHIGFGKTGDGGQVRVSYVQVDAVSNLAPRNTDIYTRFENNTYNINELYTRYIRNNADGYIRPQNDRLVFHNVTSGYLSTMYAYSNFELEFEVTDIVRQPVFDEQLNLITPITEGFTVAVGMPDYKRPEGAAFCINFGYAGGSDTRKPAVSVITVTRDGAVLERVTLPPAYHIWNEQAVRGRAVRVRAVMTDGQLDVLLQYAGEVDWYRALTFDNGSATTGCLQLVSRNTVGRNNFALAMFSLINTDYGRQVVRVSNRDLATLASDYNYLDTWNDDDLLIGREE